MNIAIPIDWSDMEAILVSIQYRLDGVQKQLDQYRLDAQKQIDRLDGIQESINRMELKMSKEMDDLAAAVAADTAVDQSAITLLGGLKQMLDAAGVDKAKLAELSAMLGSNRDALAAAVAANTPASDPPPPPPPVEPTA